MRLLKKLLKRSKKPEPPEDSVNQTADVNTGTDRDSKGENGSREISADKTDKADMPRTPDTNHGGGSRVTSQDGGLVNQQLSASNTSILTPESVGGDAGERRRF
jgi:hypothetical protein